MDAIVALIGGVLSAGVAYGMMKVKVDRLEKDIERCVSVEVFNTTVGALREDLHEMKLDLKELLKTVQEKR